MLAFTTRSTALPFQKTIKTLKKTIREKAAYANKYKSKTTTTTFALAEDEDEFNVDDGKEDEDDDQTFIDSFERDGSATSSSSSSTYPLRVKSIDALSSTTTPRKKTCLLYTSPSPRDQRGSRMPSSA